MNLKNLNINIIKWISSKGHFQGIFWTVCASFFSNLCDSSIRLVGDTLPAMQITFFRLFFGTIILLPILLYKGKKCFTVNNKLDHLFRIIIGFGAMACWIYGASQTSLPSITTISFSCPLLVLPLAYIFLGERSDWKRILSVILGFVGVIIVAFFEKSGVAGSSSNVLFFHPGVIFLFFGAMLFAMSDILNKKMLASENFFALLFYFYLGTALISLIPALLVWSPVGLEELFYLAILGSGGVSVLYCILKAANATEISAIAPYKYIELVFSIFMGYILFKEVIKVSTIVGACLIIPSAILIAYYEVNKERAKPKEESVIVSV